MVYHLFVFLHLVGVVFFVSGFVVGLLLRTSANRSRDRSTILYSFSIINYNDKRFMPTSILPQKPK